MKQPDPTTSYQPVSRSAIWLTLLLCLILPLQPALAGKIIYYHNDASGSPVMASDAQGNILWREHYRPYGEKINEVCETPCDELTDYEDIGYTGHEYDAETGLTYMQARYYDPVVGRFLAIDPVGFKPNQPMTFNRYSYANNNPYKYHDPDGRVIDTIADVGFIVYDIYKIATEGATTTNMAALGADIGGALIPGATGLGLAVRGANKGADAVRAVDNAVDAAKGADSSANGVKLQKQLASEEQLSQLSTGGGTVISQPAKQANRVAAQTGGNPANIQKVSSSAKPLKDGTQIETHAFRDASTNELIEPKTIVD